MFWIFSTDCKMTWHYHCISTTDPPLDLKKRPVMLGRLKCTREVQMSNVTLPLSFRRALKFFCLFQYSSPRKQLPKLLGTASQEAPHRDPRDGFVGWLACVFLLWLGLLQTFCLFSKWLTASWKWLGLLRRLNRGRDEVMCVWPGQHPRTTLRGPCAWLNALLILS